MATISGCPGLLGSTGPGMGPGVAGQRQLRAELRLVLELLDLLLDRAGQVAEVGLKGEQLVLLLRTRLDQLGGGLLVRLEREPAALDVALVGGDGVDGVDVAVAEPFHQVQLGDQFVEAVGLEDDVDDADVARLVDVLGALHELLVGALEVRARRLELLLVLFDLRLDGLELARRLVVLLDGDLGLGGDGAEARLDGLQARLGLGDGARRRRRGGGDEHDRHDAEHGEGGGLDEVAASVHSVLSSGVTPVG